MLSESEFAGKPAFDFLMKQLLEQIANMGYKLEEGDTKIIDAQIVEAPIRRDKKGEKKLIEEGQIPADWSEAKTRQKDLDADWKKKNKKSYFGYENHVKVDSRSKLIEEYTVTTVSVHDSQELSNLVSAEDEGKSLYADSAYRSEETEINLQKMGIKSEIHERAYKNKPLSKSQKRSNRRKSKTRARIEHTFGAIEQRSKSFLRSLSLQRAKIVIGLKNFAYNIERMAFLERSGFFRRQKAKGASCV